MRQIDKLEAATKAAHTHRYTQTHTHTHKARDIKICRANENSKKENMPRKTTNKIAALLVGLRLCSMLLTLSKVVGNLKKEDEEEGERRKREKEETNSIYILGKKSSES